MDKKKLIIIITIFISLILLISAVWGFSKYTENKKIEAEKRKIITVSNDFAEAWFNYTKQTSPIYLASIKTFMTNPFFEATKYINTSRPQDFEGQLPLKSTILETNITNFSSTAAETRVKISSSEGEDKAKEYFVDINLEKTNGDWLVSQIGSSLE